MNSDTLLSAESWLKKAISIMRYAHAGFEHSDVTGPVCVDLHQTVELCLKALLIHYGVSIQRTHNLPFLLSQVVEHNTDFEEYQDLCNSLNPYYISERYPTYGVTEPQRNEVEKLFLEVRELVEEVKVML